MITKVQKWGNSQGLRIAKEVLAGADIKVGDEVEVVVDARAIVITPVKRVRGRLRLEELVSRIPPGYEPGEEDWGAPAGRETW